MIGEQSGKSEQGVGKRCRLLVTFHQVTSREESKRASDDKRTDGLIYEAQVLLRLAFFLMVRTWLFYFLVFVQAGIQWIALVVNTVTKMLAAVWALLFLHPFVHSS